MDHWFKLVLFSVIIGLAKGAHFIKVVVLAGLGLAGLWMVHTLAQDYSTIQNGSAGAGGREFFKRSIDSDREVVDWGVVLSRDPASCVRSFLCQLSATEKELLTDTERKVLHLVRHSINEDTWASKQLQEALKNGERMENSNHCMKIYKYCPYTSRMMSTLLRIFTQ